MAANNRKKRLGLAGLTALVFVGAPAAATAFDQNIVDGWTHFVQCAGLLITDPVSHAKYCSPSNQAVFPDVYGKATATPVSSSSEEVSSSSEEVSSSSEEVSSFSSSEELPSSSIEEISSSSLFPE